MRRFFTFIAILAVMSVGVGAMAWARPAQTDAPRLAFKLPGVAHAIGGEAIIFSPTIKHLGVPNENIDFGRLDEVTGQVVDGDYLLYVRVEIGDAPLSSLEFKTSQAVDPVQLTVFRVTPDTPVTEGFATINDGAGITPNNIIALFQTSMLVQADASTGMLGTARVSIALVDDPKHNVRRLPAVTHDIDVLVVDGPATWPSWQLLQVGAFDR